MPLFGGCAKIPIFKPNSNFHKASFSLKVYECFYFKVTPMILNLFLQFSYLLRYQTMSRKRICFTTTLYNPLLWLSLIVIISFAFFYSLQFSVPHLVGIDSYFHIKFSQMMREQGFISSLPWLQYTIHKDYFRDHHFLYHVLYIPFTFGDLINGAKWAAVFFPSLAVIAFYWLLSINKIKFAFVWTLFFMVSSHSFLFRMCMSRVQSISLLFMILGILFITRKKYLALSVLAFFFVWLYDGYFMLMVIVLIFFFSKWLIDGKCDRKLLIYFFSGLILGIIINPYFPYNITSYLFNLTRVTRDSGIVKIGAEWEPYKTWFLLKDSGLVWLLFFSAILFNSTFGIKCKSKSISLLLISLFFFILLFKSRRSIEYWPPFGILFSAFAWDGLIPVKKGMEIFAKKRFNVFLVTFGTILLGVFSTINFIEARKDIKQYIPVDYYKGAAKWLKANSMPRSIVFNTDWDDFPQLFFYNTKNYYIVGLDANYMYKFDPKLYLEWKKITRGKIENPSVVIRELFYAHYIVTDNNHNRFIDNAKKDKQCEIVYRDKYCTVFIIKNN